MAPFAAAVAAAAISPFAPQALIIGPLKLGDLILSSPDGDWLVKDFEDGGLDVNEVKKLMNEWKLYVVDHKVRTPDGRWDWHRSEKARRPNVIVEGRMSIELKDRRGEKVEIAMTEARAIGVDTNHRSPSWVRCPIVITLRFHNLAIDEGGGIVAWPKEGNTMIPTIRYDVTGRSTIEKRKK